MLMMFGAALRKAPFERAMPFNDSDLMVLISPKIGFRLCNISNERGESFKIRDFMNENEKVFGNISFEERLNDFVSIFPGRVERFFKTKKSNYIFFDEEEQKFLRKLMSKPGLSCSVEMYRYYEDRSPKKIELLDLSYDDALYVTKFLSACKVRMIMNARDYYYIAKERYDKDFERKSNFKKRAEKETRDEMSIMFKRYSKLMDLKNKEKVQKYFKQLTIKYHPDKEGGDTETCAQIRSDFDTIKSSRWYLNLADK